jgi:hypothetical protein
MDCFCQLHCSSRRIIAACSRLQLDRLELTVHRFDSGFDQIAPDFPDISRAHRNNKIALPGYAAQMGYDFRKIPADAPPASVRLECARRGPRC